VACAEGSYKDQAGDASCSVCHTNSQSPAASISAEACYCIADFFGPPLGPCTACPANSHALAGSVLGDSCACNAGYGGVNGGECNLCDAGSYRENNYAVNWARSCGLHRNEPCLTQQSGTASGGHSDLAVDGIFTTATQTPHGAVSAWWRVDLPETVTVIGLGVTGRNEASERTLGYSVYVGCNNAGNGVLDNSTCVSEQPALPHNRLAAVFDGSVDTYAVPSKNVTCGTAVRGQHTCIDVYICVYACICIWMRCVSMILFDASRRCC